MRKILPILILLISNFSTSQTRPFVYYASKNEVIGFFNYLGDVSAKYSKDGLETIDKFTVTVDNKFNIPFTKAPLSIGTKILVYSTKSPKDSISVLVKSDEDIVKSLNKTITAPQLDYQQQQNQINAYAAEKDALKNTTLIYQTSIWSTNFSIPLVRFNFVKGDENKQGDILLFNSIGAGIGWYKGRLERTRDNVGEIVNEEFSNSVGINLGFLFSAGTGEDTKNVFAPVLNFCALDMQIGFGAELGTRSPNQKKEFITLSYAIPMYKLFKKGYRISKHIGLPSESIHKTQH